MIIPALADFKTTDQFFCAAVEVVHKGKTDVIKIGDARKINVQRHDTIQKNFALKNWPSASFVYCTEPNTEKEIN